MGRRPKPRPVILCNRPGCGVALTARQQTAGVRHCCMACANAMRAEVRFRECQRCGKPLTNAQMRNRGKYCGPACARADRLHYPHEKTAPAPVAPQEPAQQATGRVLGREPRGGAHYELGTVNGHLMVFEVWQGRRALYCAYSAWEGSQAWRRCHTPQPVVLPMGAEPVTAWGRRRQGEEVTE